MKLLKKTIYSFISYNDTVLKRVKGLVIDLPRPKNISYFWKFGSLLGLTLLLQVISGLFLSTNYVADVNLAFLRVDLISRERRFLWIFRDIHIIGASMYFLFIFLHIGRGLYYSSWKGIKVWVVGVLILLLSMLTAFLGYVLPWGQMSYWGATVITKLLSAFPLIGPFLVSWIWGGFSVGGPTLNRFFSLHFLFPFIILGLVILHLVYLHEKGSSNPLELNSSGDKIKFFPYFIFKDIFGFLIIFFFFSLFFLNPNFFVEREKFIVSNPLITPIHIQPEWYFLAAYAILRCIPKKLGGVLALIFAVIILLVYIFSFTTKILNFKNSLFSSILFWFWVFNFLFLTWLGSMVVEDPFIILSQISGILYFFFYFFQLVINLLNN